MGGIGAVSASGGIAMKTSRRDFLQLAAALPAPGALTPTLASAQAYRPGRCECIVGYAAGRGTDIFIRLMGQSLSERIGQPSSSRTAQAPPAISRPMRVRTAPADGLYDARDRCGRRLNATLYDNLNFNFVRDIGGRRMIRGPLAVMVASILPAKTVPSTSPMPRPIRARSAWRRPATNPTQSGRRIVQGDDPRRYDDVPYRGAGPAITDLLVAGAGLFRQHTGGDRAYPGPASCACWR